MESCKIHIDCKATVKLNGISICYECWDKGTTCEREWLNNITEKYQKGLITEQQFDEGLFTIGYHQVDPSVPVFF